MNRKQIVSWAPPSLRTVIQSMQENIAEAARLEGEARRRVASLGDGLMRTGAAPAEALALKGQRDQAERDAIRYRSEQVHWREYLEYYRGLLRKFPLLADRPAEEAVKRDFAKTANVIDMEPARPHWSEAPRLLPVPNQPQEVSEDEIPF